MPQQESGSPRTWGGLLFAAALTAIVFAHPSPLDATVHSQAAGVAGPVRTFVGPDGNPLPFENDDELMEFLRTAEVIDASAIGGGINSSQKMLLGKNGVRAHAIFREVDETKRDTSLAGRFYPVFRDSYLFECAAYELGKRLGIFNVPPVVLRRINLRDGSLQIWIEDVRDEEEQGFKPPNSRAWVRQLRDMILLDNLIFNIDRNAGNMLITKDYTLVFIDHTRAFQEKSEVLNPERLTHANRDVWEKLRSLTEQELRDAVRPFLTPGELNALVRRRQMILDHFGKLMETRAEDAVLQ